MTETPPLTRRELRTRPAVPDLALVPACDPPLTRRALREASRPPRRLPTARQMIRAVPLGRQAAAIALGLALAGGVGTLSTASPGRGGTGATPVVVTDTAAARAASTAAAGARLTAQATAYAAQVRAEAADSARLALTRSDAVLTAAAELRSGADLSGLENSAAQLAALLTEAGVPVEEVAVEVGAAGAALPPPAPVPGPTAPASPDVETVAPDVETVAPDVETGAPDVGTGAPDVGTGAPDVGTGAPDVGTGAPEAGTGAPEAGEDAAEATPSPASASPSQSPTDGPARPSSPAGLPEPPASEVAEFDAAVRIMALAQQVDGLVAAVQADIDATKAAAEALAANVAEVQGYENGAIPVDLLCAPAFAPDALLRCDAAAALEELNIAFVAEFEEDLDVVSAYRDYATQVTTRYRRGGLAARPGTSNHGLGLAVDLGDFGRLGYFGAPFYEWMSENSEAYGWFHPEHMGPGGSGPREPWHWEFDPALLEGGESTPLPGTD